MYSHRNLSNKTIKNFDKNERRPNLKGSVFMPLCKCWDF